MSREGESVIDDYTQEEVNRSRRGSAPIDDRKSLDTSTVTRAIIELNRVELK